MTDRSDVKLWQIIQAIAVVLVLGFFLLQTQSVLNPVLLLVLLWAVMFPFRGKPGHTTLLITAGVLTLIWLLAATDTLLAPFVLAGVLAYILDPLADRIEARGVPRTLAVIMLMVPAVGLLVVAFLVVLPAAIHQLGEALQSAPVFFQRLSEWIERSQERLVDVDIPFVDVAELQAQLRSVDGAAVVTFLQERQAEVVSSIWTGVLGVGRGLGFVLTVVGYVALTPILTFYLIRDWDRVTAAVASLVPERQRSEFLSFAGACDGLVSSYLRGQVTVAISIGLITGVGLALVGFDYAATLGLIVAIFSVIPYLGLILSLIPAIFIALVSGSVGVSLLKVAGVYGVAQLVDGFFITPKIVGDSVGIHPVWVVLALTLGGFFFGFAGLLIGVPAAAVIKLLIGRGLERYKASDFYDGGDGAVVG